MTQFAGVDEEELAAAAEIEGRQDPAGSDTEVPSAVPGDES